MIKILFICHGNICRSPMGMFILSKMVREEGLSEYFQIDSAATSTEELGNPVYPPAYKKLRQMG
ncbi:MAG: low molecular weight phosphotyrosine protein phosphatase, partial [Lachnospiraceae bacterium]|nr:low molecular weight phosphotyrosine protein phosphatase [Lachnospiraceae bacterium]